MKIKLSFVLFLVMLLFVSNSYAQFTQKSDSLGLVVMQAENYDSVRPGSKGDTFADSTSLTGFTGSGYMQGSDSQVYNPDTTALKNAPALYYNITFVKTGAHYIWARKYFIDGNNDSFYYGVDDTIGSQSDLVPHGAYGTWEWVKGPTTINITTAGVHKLGIYLRERAAAVDQIIITSSDAFDPNVNTEWLPKEIAFVSLPGKIDPATDKNADQPFINELLTQGYLVHTVYTSSLETASQGLIDTLNNADLVIIGRSGSSGDFGGTHKAAWNAITSPLMALHLYIARNNRLNWLPTGTTTANDNIGGTVVAKIMKPNDPVFSGVTIAADSTMDWVVTPYDFMATTNGGNGTVMARETGTSNVLFVRWDPWKEFYSGAVDMPAGYRTLIGNGNDHAGPFNYYNFTPGAKKVYLKEVARMTELGKVAKPVKKVAYVTNKDKQADLAAGAAPVNDDPVIRLFKDDDNFEVTVLAVSADSTFDLSGYDVVVAQESFNSSAAVYKPGGPLGFATIPVPFLFNKVYTMRDGRGFQGGAAGTGAELEGTYTIDVAPAKQGNDLFKGLTFTNNQLTLLNVGADDNGGDTRTKGLNYATGVVISDTATLLGMQTGAPANATVCINDVPAGAKFGSETLKARMITIGFNFGALVSNNGNNVTAAGLTIWRNAVYSLAGLTVPSTPVIIVGVESGTETIPSAYSLQQNYPNPFNPTTTIEFTIPNYSRVELAVYDILGRLVTKLVDGNFNAGRHKVQFNASNLASGVYFYRIEAGDYVNVKKLLLLK